MLPDKSTSAPDCEALAVATLIVASLHFEGYLPLNLQNSDSRQDYVNAIELTATIIARTKAEPGDVPSLPFVWGRTAQL
jgi:hypothetical protein